MEENKVNENLNEVNVEHRAYTQDEMIEVINQYEDELKNNEFKFLYNPIEFSDDDMGKIKDSDPFMKGICESSTIIGMYNAMINSGIDVDTVAKVVLNYQTMKHNIEFQKVVNEGLKYQSNLIKNQSL